MNTEFKEKLKEKMDALVASAGFSNHWNTRKQDVINLCIKEIDIQEKQDRDIRKFFGVDVKESKTTNSDDDHVRKILFG